MPGLLTVDIVTFVDQIELTHSFAQPENVKIELVPRGSTALYDAVGRSLNGFGEALAKLPEHARPGTVLVTIVTDGMENTSSEYSPEVIAKLFARQRDKYQWDISFLGANQDAIFEARKIGVGADDALTNSSTVGGVPSALLAQSHKASQRRTGLKTGFTSDERGAAQDGERPVT